MGEAIDALAEQTPNQVDKKLLKNYWIQTSLLVAGQGKMAQLGSILNSSNTLIPVLDKMKTNPALKDYAATFLAVLNYLEASK